MSEQDVNGMHNERTEDFLTELIPPEESNMTTPVLTSDGAEKDNSSEVNPDDLYEGVRAPKLFETPAEEPVSKADNDAEVSESFKGPLFKEEDLVEAVDEIKSPVLVDSVKQEAEFKEPILNEPDLQDLSDPLAYSAREKALASRQFEASQKSHRPVLVSDDDDLLSLDDAMSVDSKKEKPNKKHSLVEKPEDDIKAPVLQGDDDDFISEYADIGADKQAPAKKVPVKKEDASNALSGTRVGLVNSGSGGAGPGESAVGKVEESFGKIEEEAKKASEVSKKIGRKGPKGRLQDKKGLQRDWTDVAGAVKKTQDNIWQTADSLEDAGKQLLNGVKNGIGQDDDLRSSSNRGEYNADLKDLNKVESFGQSGTDSGFNKGKQGARNVINAPVNSVDKIGSLYNKKKQIERWSQKIKGRKLANEQAAIDAKKTAATASRVKNAGRVVKGGAEASKATASAGTKAAKASAKAAKETTKQAAVAAKNAAKITAKATAKTAETSVKTGAAAAKAGATAAKATNPVGWIMLAVELIIAVLCFVVIVCILYTIFYLFIHLGTSQSASGINEDGLATTQQRVDFQRHMFLILETYKFSGKTDKVKGWDIYAAAKNYTEFDKSILNEEYIRQHYPSAYNHYSNDTWGDHYFQSNNSYHSYYYSENGWCANWAVYVYKTLGYDICDTLPTTLQQDHVNDNNFVRLGLVPNSNGTTTALRMFAADHRAVPFGGSPSASRYSDYIPTVGDWVCKGPKTDEIFVAADGNTYATCKHTEIVLAVDYEHKVFYTICGNGTDHKVCIRKRVIGQASGNEVWCLGRVFSRPAEAYPAAPT